MCGRSTATTSPQIGEAIEAAQEAKGAPLVIIANTVKGKGVDFMENKVQWHYGSVDSDWLREPRHRSREVRDG